MDRDRLITELSSLIADFLKCQGLELVDLIYRYEGGKLFLRILTDRPEGGITLEECSTLNKEIGYILEGKNIIQAKFILEVSSPGIERPLVTKSDFQRSINRNARFHLSEPIKAKLEWVGVIKEVDDAAVHIDVKGDIIRIPLDKINKAKQIIG